MNKKTKSIGIALVAILVAGVSQATLVYSNDFESYTAGNLVGQDSWATSGGAPSPRVTTGVGSNTSKVLGATTSTVTIANASRNVSLGLGSYTSGTFSVDFYRGAGTPEQQMYAGFGYSVSNSGGVAFYATSANIYYRPGASAGTSVLMYDAVNDSTITAINAWERLTMNLDFQNNQITSVYIQNLTTPAPARQLFFNSAATVATQTYLVDETNWDRAYARTGLSTQREHYMDNLSLSAIPEPATIGMLGLGAVITLLVRRKLML
jgi:hypothetical protein